MGQDIDSVLIYGTVLTVDEIKPFMKAYEISNEDMFSDAFLDFCEKIGNEFQTLYIGHASPYYDSNWEDWTIYVSIHDPSITNVKINDILTLDDGDYLKFFTNIGQTPPEIQLIAIPHVW
jgi:hypothetical protein